MHLQFPSGEMILTTFKLSPVEGVTSVICWGHQDCRGIQVLDH